MLGIFPSIGSRSVFPKIVGMILGIRSTVFPFLISFKLSSAICLILNFTDFTHRAFSYKFQNTKELYVLYLIVDKNVNWRCAGDFSMRFPGHWRITVFRRLTVIYQYWNEVPGCFFDRTNCEFTTSHRRDERRELHPSPNVVDEAGRKIFTGVS